MFVLTLLMCLTLLPTNVLAFEWFIEFTQDLKAEYEMVAGGSLPLKDEVRIGNVGNQVGWTYIYQWYRKPLLGIMFVEISGATGSSYSISTATRVNSAGQYYCRMTATHISNIILTKTVQ